LNGIYSGSCPVEGFCLDGVETSRSITEESANWSTECSYYWEEEIALQLADQETLSDIIAKRLNK